MLRIQSLDTSWRVTHFQRSLIRETLRGKWEKVPDSRPGRQDGASPISPVVCAEGLSNYRRIPLRFLHNTKPIVARPNSSA